jgi:hypothetical protein
MEDYKFSMGMRCRKGIGRPGVTQKRLITSARRYGMGTLSILKTEAQMWKLRHMFRRGASAGMLKDKYEDIR